MIKFAQKKDTNGYFGHGIIKKIVAFLLDMGMSSTVGRYVKAGGE
jgi:hypothetical protein